MHKLKEILNIVFGLAIMFAICTIIYIIVIAFLLGLKEIFSGLF